MLRGLHSQPQLRRRGHAGAHSARIVGVGVVVVVIRRAALSAVGSTSIVVVVVDGKAALGPRSSQATPTTADGVGTGRGGQWKGCSRRVGRGKEGRRVVVVVTAFIEVQEWIAAMIGVVVGKRVVVVVVAVR